MLNDSSKHQAYETNEVENKWKKNLNHVIKILSINESEF